MKLVFPSDVLPLPLWERAGVRGKRETSDRVTSQLYFQRFPLILTLSRKGERGPDARPPLTI
jgi:hypothetical protein